jgi:hypothetical protein
MTSAINKSDAEKVRELRQAVLAATDQQVLKIVEAVERAADRGPADNLLVPLRRRLSVLQPPRRLRFSRLLFHTLTPVIVPASRWRPSDPMLPRTAVTPIANVVLAALGQQAAHVTKEIAARTTADIDFIRTAGTKIWPSATKILAGSAAPPEWRGTGFSEPTYKTLTWQIAALLSQAAAFEALCDTAPDAQGLPDADAVMDIVRGVCTVSENGLPMLFNLFLMRLPEAVPLLRRPVPGSQTAAIAAAFNQAAELRIEQIATEGPEDWIDRGSTADAGAAARRMATLLNNLQRTNLRPARRTMCEQLLVRLDEACRNRFQASLQTDLLTPLRELQTSPRPVPAPTLEANVRGLRILEMQARSIGSAAIYDSLLATAAETVKSPAIAERLGVVDRARLVEILTTPDAALAMLAKRS